MLDEVLENVDEIEEADYADLLEGSVNTIFWGITDGVLILSASEVSGATAQGSFSGDEVFSGFYDSESHAYVAEFVLEFLKTDEFTVVPQLILCTLLLIDEIGQVVAHLVE